jgi:crotonobetainyl-CoA:carnitine CoA-transferase CaiB-like acyl-CoA transferase
MDPVPALGEHTEAILSGLGYASADIAALRAEHAI